MLRQSYICKEESKTFLRNNSFRGGVCYHCVNIAYEFVIFFFPSDSLMTLQGYSFELSDHFFGQKKKFL